MFRRPQKFLATVLLGGGICAGGYTLMNSLQHKEEEAMKHYKTNTLPFGLKKSIFPEKSSDKKSEKQKVTSLAELQSELIRMKKTYLDSDLNFEKCCFFLKNCLTISHYIAVPTGGLIGLIAARKGKILKKIMIPVIFATGGFILASYVPDEYNRALVETLKLCDPDDEVCKKKYLSCSQIVTPPPPPGPKTCKAVKIPSAKGYCSHVSNRPGHNCRDD